MKPIEIPAVGSIRAHSLDPLNRDQVQNHIDRANAYFRRSAKAWVEGNNSGNPETLELMTGIERDTAQKGEALLAPLGIKCDWPGLYPSFTVNGYSEHDTESAVLAALGHPRDWLR